MPPKLIGPYRVVETLGSGGVGTVFRAFDKRTNETVALKLLSAGPAMDPRAARRLAREFETLADLSHPNVVKVFDTGVYQGYPYLTMELVEGLTLRHYLSLAADDVDSNRSVSHSSTADALRRAMLDPPSEDAAASESSSAAAAENRDVAFGLSDFNTEPPSEDASGYGQGPGGLLAYARAMDEPDTEDSDADAHLPFSRGATSESAPEAAPIARPNLDMLNRAERVGRMKDSMLQLCEALSYIHARGLIHRDLKPSNVMVDEERMVRLMDFGLAKFLADDAAVTADGRLVGTFRYMAPEQILGEPLDARADLYSLGVILYELLVGRPPFDAKSPYELWQKVLETEAPSILALNPDADLQLARVASRLMRKEPPERYQTAEEVFEALNE